MQYVIQFKMGDVGASAAAPRRFTGGLVGRVSVIALGSTPEDETNDLGLRAVAELQPAGERHD
jgi:hypothetical protein